MPKRDLYQDHHGLRSFDSRTLTLRRSSAGACCSPIGFRGNRHLAGRSYLFGGRPAFGDFGLAPQIYQAYVDPTGFVLLGTQFTRSPPIIWFLPRTCMFSVALQQDRAGCRRGLDSVVKLDNAVPCKNWPRSPPLYLFWRWPVALAISPAQVHPGVDLFFLFGFGVQLPVVTGQRSSPHSPTCCDGACEWPRRLLMGNSSRGRRWASRSSRCSPSPSPR